MSFKCILLELCRQHIRLSCTEQETMSSPDSAMICSSDLESQPKSATFDDDYEGFPTPNSEDLAPPSSDNECALDSAEFRSASSIGSCKSHPEHKGRPEMPEMSEQTEEQPPKTKKRLRMLDEDAERCPD